MGRTRHIPWILLATLSAWTGCSAGCSSSRSSGWFHKPKTSQDYLDMALEAPGADERRKGVIGLASTRDGKSDWAMKVYDTVARTDRDPMVRCAALRAMASAAGAEQVPTLLKLLQSSTHAVQDCRSASGPVRWEAAKLLLAIVRDYSYQESQRETIVQAFMERLARDKERNVRMAAIEALSYFAEPAVPNALIDVLEEDDFALQHAAEQSLMALTGQTHDHDAKAWRKWLAQTKDPFAQSGQIPDGVTDKKTVWGEWPW